MKSLFSSLLLGCCLCMPAFAAPSQAPAALLKPAGLRQKAPATFRVRFETTQGNFTMKVHRAWSPLGADRFYNLVANKFYDGQHFFRVLPNFVVQWGIHGEPRIASAWSKAAILDDPKGQSNLKGRVTFATGGPNTRTTQLFINLVDNPRLDDMGFTPFAEIEGQGLAVVQKFYSGYGEGAPMGRGPNQGRMEREGEAYLQAQFPKLDRIKKAVIEK